MKFDEVVARIRRALLLDGKAFEEARDDATFTPWALAAAAVSVLLAGLGAFLWSQVIVDEAEGFFLEAFILGTFFLIVLWIFGMLVTWALLTWLYGETLTWDGVMRVGCLGHLPFAVSLFVFVPGLAFAFGILAVAAMFFYTTYGLRAAYPKIGEFRIMVATLAGFALWVLLLTFLTSHERAFAPGVFVFEWSEDVLEAGGYSIDIKDFISPGQ